MADTDGQDVVIAGGAVMGSAVAYWLTADPGFRGAVTVVERDPTYAKAASALSASSIRQQFSSPVNIRASLFGIAFLREVGERLAVDNEAPAIGLNEAGYLYLATDAGAPVLASNGAIQIAEGADIVLMDRDALRARFPFPETSDLAGGGAPAGAWGRTGEGWFDGWALMSAFRAKARAQGARFLGGSVAGVDMRGTRVEAVRLSDGTRLSCGHFVNCAGASGGRALARACGFDPPVVARKRCVFGFRAADPVPGLPLTIDTSGVYVRPEGEGFICGVSPADNDAIARGEDEAQDFSVDWPLFEEVIWPALAARVPAFERIKPGRAWAGHYDMNGFDHNALCGRVPGLDNALIALGFSGHGIQQAPALGRALAETIVHGRTVTLDVSDLSPSRLLQGRRLLEANVI